VHLQRTVAAAQRHAPLAISEHLDLVVAGRLDVELDQHVLVVADTRGLHFGQDVARELGNGIGLGEDPLALPTAAADRLEAEASTRVLRQQSLGFEAAGLRQVVDRKEVEAGRVGGIEEL